MKIGLEQARKAIATDPKSQDAVERLAVLVGESRLQGQSTLDPFALCNAPAAVQEADILLKRNRLEDAEIVLRGHLAHRPDDPWAMLGMADIAQRCGFVDNAERILKRSIASNPQMVPSWIALAQILYQRGRSHENLELVDEAIEALNSALAIRSEDPAALWQKTCILMELRRLEEARLTLECLLDGPAASSHIWMSYGYVLKTLGEFGGAVAAYRMAVILEPENAAAWWGLANLKLFEFFDSDIAAMERALSQSPGDSARLELHFALAKALDGKARYDHAAHHLLEGNRLRLSSEPHSREEVARTVDEATRTYSRSFFEARAGQGSQSVAPIFVIGLPRSGSTLLEQILSSHSQVEGTEELFAIPLLEAEFRKRHEGTSLEKAIATASPAELLESGERYLELASLRRTTGRPFFIDKNPSNWRYVGLIASTLPNAKIIDSRRNPMDCCFANYAQHFHWGVNFSYGQAEIASQYREYLRLMRHFDLVLPGHIHHVIHDDLVDSFEVQVRRLLRYLGLEFEDSCLRYFENKRAVHTPSSEQVRQPINKSGFGKWRNYEPWLGEMKTALGATLHNWRD